MTDFRSWHMRTFRKLQAYGALYGNGTDFDGYLGAVQRGEVDTFAADITPSTQRLPYFEFSTPWLMDERIIVSGKVVRDTFLRRIALMLRTFDDGKRVDCVK